ncbi:MAG: hypothetical protein EZS28_000758 [Streblomastix strix]|uniref:Uncharacterized protein n=1 Tax=Streblomastix strix TaxID=222440 RepID=A0A5J4XB35_9EUKA|nr:MAG: hypothetical protein EZS28_000758 [Streblomastix strix]
MYSYKQFYLSPGPQSQPPELKQKKAFAISVRLVYPMIIMQSEDTVSDINFNSTQYSLNSTPQIELGRCECVEKLQQLFIGGWVLSIQQSAAISLAYLFKSSPLPPQFKPIIGSIISQIETLCNSGDQAIKKDERLQSQIVLLAIRPTMPRLCVAVVFTLLWEIYLIQLEQIVMSNADDDVVIKPKTKKLFEKLKNVIKIFDEIDDIDDFAKKVSKYKRADEVPSTDSGSERSTSDHIMQYYRKNTKRRRKIQLADCEHSIKSFPHLKHLKHTQSRHRKRNKKIKHNPERKRQYYPSENSSSDSSTASSNYSSIDDDIVHNDLRKIIGDSISHYMPLVYKFSISRIEKDILTVKHDKIDFLTADRPRKLEENDDDDAAKSIIQIAATTRSVFLKANVAAKSPKQWCESTQSLIVGGERRSWTPQSRGRRRRINKNFTQNPRTAK